MNVFRSLMVLSAVVLVACAGAAPPARLPAAEALTVTNGVRAFMSTVADGVTRRGPAAWQDYFEDTPAFFMASEGRMVFENADAATQGIKELTKSIAHIALRWGDPLRVDPLTSTLAMVAAPYHEDLTDAGGHQVVEDGYFTALAELGPKGWRFRNAHWSVATSPPVVR